MGLFNNYLGDKRANRIHHVDKSPVDVSSPPLADFLSACSYDHVYGNSISLIGFLRGLRGELIAVGAAGTCHAMPK